jgi:aminoglycoside phosphotransferase (APT) family kinase protein
VTSFEILSGGYSPLAPARVTFADTTTAVIKAAPKGDGPHFQLYGRLLIEIHTGYLQLPGLERWRPGYLDHFETSAWLALVIEDLGPPHEPPWDEAASDQVAVALASFHQATHREAAPVPLPPRRPTDHWAALNDLVGVGTREANRWWREDSGRDWILSAAPAASPAIAELEILVADNCVIHDDVRADNLCLSPDKVVMLDWASVKWSDPAWDAVYFALGVEASGGPTAPDVFARYEAAGGTTSEAAVRGVLSHYVGTFSFSRLAASARGQRTVRLPSIPEERCPEMAQ